MRQRLRLHHLCFKLAGVFAKSFKDFAGAITSSLENATAEGPTVQMQDLKTSFFSCCTRCGFDNFETQLRFREGYDGRALPCYGCSREIPTTIDAAAFIFSYHVNRFFLAIIASLDSVPQ